MEKRSQRHFQTKHQAPRPESTAESQSSCATPKTTPPATSIRFLISRAGRSSTYHELPCHTQVVSLLNEKLRTKLGLPRKQKVNLMLDGRPLKPNHTLAQVGLKPFQTLTVALPMLKGGATTLGKDDEDASDLIKPEAFGLDEKVKIVKYQGFVNDASDKQKEDLIKRLETTDFYLGLNSKTKDKVKGMISKDQIDEITRIDLRFGYRIKFTKKNPHQTDANQGDSDEGDYDEEDDDSSLFSQDHDEPLKIETERNQKPPGAKENYNRNYSNLSDRKKYGWIFTAYNMASRKRRFKVFETIFEQKEALFDVAYKYLCEKYKENPPERVREQGQTKLEPTEFREQMDQAEQDEQDWQLAKLEHARELAKRWANEHWLRIDKQYDIALVEKLLEHKDLHADLLIPLPRGMRLLPILKQLHWHQKIQILIECIDSSALCCSTFLDAMIQSSESEPAERIACEALQSMYPIIDNDSFRIMVKIFDQLPEEEKVDKKPGEKDQDEKTLPQVVETFFKERFDKMVQILLTKQYASNVWSTMGRKSVLQTSLIKLCFEPNKTYVGKAEKAEEHFNKFWNHLMPCVRKKLARETFEDATKTLCKLTRDIKYQEEVVHSKHSLKKDQSEVDNCERALKIYSILDLDSQAELYALVGSTRIINEETKKEEEIDIMDKFLELVSQGAMSQVSAAKVNIEKSMVQVNDSSSDEIVPQLEPETNHSAHLRSESLHHRFFHLRKPFKIKEQKDKDQQDTTEDKARETCSKKYTQLEKDMKAAWKYIPFDVAGDYLQTIPLTSENDSNDEKKKTYRFIAVQPFCHKNLSNVFQRGQVVNKNSQEPQSLLQRQKIHTQKTELMARKASLDWRKNCEIKILEEEKTKGDTMFNQKMYSIVSFWEFDDKTETFSCFKSFISPTIVPCIGPSEKRHRKRYVLKGEKNEIFFFCQTDKKDSEDLQLCEIDLSEENMHNKSRKFEDNVTITEIKKGQGEDGYEMFKFLAPEKYPNIQKCRQNEIRFHQIAPTLIDTGESAGKFLAFSFSELGSMGPTLHMFSLRQKKIVLKIQSAELLIDFVTEQRSQTGKRSSSQGWLYFLSDAQHFVQGTELINAHSITQQALKLQDSMVVKMEIDFSEIIKMKEPVQIKCEKGEKKIQFKRIDGAGEVNKQLRYTCYIPPAVEIDDEDKTPEQRKEVTNLNNVFSRFQHRIVDIQPTSRDQKLGQLNKFCVITRQHLKKDNQAYIINLDHNDEEGKSGRIRYAENQIEGGPFSDCFIVNIDDKTTSIQTVKRDDQVQIIQMYDPQTKECTLEKRMQIPVGSVYLPQQMLIKKGEKPGSNDLLGCFLDRDQFAAHWMYEKNIVKSDIELGKSYQTESCEPLYIVEYPLICFTGPFPDKGEIRIVNLADKKATRVSLELENMQVESFVSHRCWSDKTKICFIVQDLTKGISSVNQKQDRVSFIILNCERMMQKKLAQDLSYFSFTKEWLGDMSDDPTFRTMMSKAIKVEAVHDLLREQDDLSQCLVIQSNEAMYLYTNEAKPKEEVSSSNLLKLTNKQMMQQVRFKRGYNNTFYYAEHSESNDADLIKELIVIDVKNVNGFTHTDRVAHQLLSGQVIAMEMDVKDYEIDSNLLSDGSFGERQVLNKIFFIDDSYQLMSMQQNDDDTYKVSEHTDLAELHSFAQALRHMAIEPFSRISITERCITIDNKTVNLRNDYTWDLSINTINDKKAVKKKKWQAWKTQTLDNAYQQLMLVRRRLKSNEDNQDKSASLSSLYEKYENAFVVKPLPGSRKICLVGSKGLKAIELIEFISDDLMLIKMFGNYWTCIDTHGQIQRIEPQLYEILHCRNVVEMSTRRIHKKNQVILMLNAQRHITSVVFDHRGKICEKVRTSEKFIEGRLSKPTEKVDAIESSPTMLLSDDAQLYRVSNKNYIGLEQQENGHFESQILDKIIRINFTTAHTSTIFVACGDYLCWQHPESSKGCIIYYAKFEKFISDNMKKYLDESGESQAKKVNDETQQVFRYYRINPLTINKYSIYRLEQSILSFQQVFLSKDPGPDLCLGKLSKDEVS